MSTRNYIFLTGVTKGSFSIFLNKSNLLRRGPSVVPTDRMKRFYLAPPLDRENLTLKIMGELGAAQLTRKASIERAVKSEIVDAYTRFMRTYKRLDNAPAGISDKTRPETAGEIFVSDHE